MILFTCGLTIPLCVAAGLQEQPPTQQGIGQLSRHTNLRRSGVREYNSCIGAEMADHRGHMTPFLSYFCLQGARLCF